MNTKEPTTAKAKPAPQSDREARENKDAAERLIPATVAMATEQFRTPGAQK